MVGYEPSTSLGARIESRRLWDAVHWSSIGTPGAADTDIFFKTGIGQQCKSVRLSS